VLGRLATDRGMPFVCVQPMLTSWSRRAEDLTNDKTDEKDAVLIARLTAQLRCYEPEPVDETWARLRHLGARREQLITEIGSQLQQMRDLLDCVWPVALDTARQPFRSRTWIAARSGPRRSCPRPATRAASPPFARWSNPPAWHVRSVTLRLYGCRAMASTAGETGQESLTQKEAMER
jgi:hypothetical protein